MKYHITPFNFISVILFYYGVFYISISRSTDGWGILFGVTFLGVGFIIFAFNFFLQYLSVNYKRVVILETAATVLLLFLIYKGSGTRNFIIPSNFLGQITIVYEIKGFPELPSSYLSNQQNIVVPKNGLIITSSKKTNSYPITEIVFINQKEKNYLDITPASSDTISIGSIIYPLETWIVRKKSDWTVKDLNSAQKNLIRKRFINNSSAAIHTFTPSGL